MDAKVRMYLAECFGTFLFVLFSAGTVCSLSLPDAAPIVGTWGVPLSAALAEGITLGLVISLTAHLSRGCCNPAVTLALFVVQQLERGRLFMLLFVQLLGSFLAAMVLRSLYAGQLQTLIDARLGCPHLKALAVDGNITLLRLFAGVGVEAIGTCLLTLVAFATVVDKRVPKVPGVGIGLAQVVVVLLGFSLTGGAANPARWFGPAVWQYSLALPPSVEPMGDHMVYWLGPVLGALAAGIFYVKVLLPKNR